MEIQNLIYIFIFFASIYFLTQKNTIEKVENISDMNAAEACKKISSRAEEIEAQYKGAADVISAAWGFLSPRNYRSGDNTSNDLMRNIINTNMTQEDITKISNDCKNSTVGMQLNEIDTTDCQYCQINGCDISNITQENINKSDQTCAMQSAIETLMKKTNSIDAQALAQTLQKAQGVLSGDNISKKENCNIVNTNMSSKAYLEARAECANNLSIDQVNRTRSCGAATNIIQRNASKNTQDCISANTVVKETEIKGDTKLKTEQKSEQTSEGISPVVSFASLGISVSSVISLFAAALIFIVLKKQKN